MRTSALVAFAVCVASVSVPGAPLAAQTRDRPTLVFTVSGAYLDDVGLWAVPDQVINLGGSTSDHLRLVRSVGRTFGAGFAGTYFKGQHLGLNAEAFLIGLGYDDACAVVGTPTQQANIERCNFIQERDRSAAAVVASVGGIYRIASREFISPFIRLGAGVLINNQSPLLLTAEANNGELLTIYNDDDLGTRLRPAFGIGVGATIAMSAGTQLRWEVRDNIVGIQAVTGPVTTLGTQPPFNTIYKHIFSLNVGIDVVLERSRGRRY